MAEYRLRLSAPARLSRAEAQRTLLWASEDRTSFVTRFGPSLRELGDIPRPNIEFVRLAVAIVAADRSTPRRAFGSNWSQRDIEVTIPVFNPDRWEAISDRLVVLIGFLSGDNWQLRFVRARSPNERIRTRDGPTSQVVLLSGGADSAIGALHARHALGMHPCTLVSHIGATNISPIQKDIAGRLETLIDGGPQQHIQIPLVRGSKRVDGTCFPKEDTMRSRSLLFLALGLAVASIDQVELLVPENGFASLNPPLGPDQRGSLSTRTTHPAFLAGLRDLLPEAGVHASLHNPLDRLTKGETFRQAADLVGNDAASKFLSSTHSCAHTGHCSFGLPVTSQCGVCFGCLVRRSAFLAAGLHDGTDYLIMLDRPDLSSYLADKSMERSMQEFLERGVRSADIAILSLPSSYAGRAALDICSRASDELRLLWP